MTKLGSMNHLRLTVSDIPRAERFYSVVLGFLGQVDALHDVLKKIGATVLDAPADYDFEPGYYAVFFADPDGMKLELVHVPPGY